MKTSRQWNARRLLTRRQATGAAGSAVGTALSVFMGSTSDVATPSASPVATPTAETSTQVGAPVPTTLVVVTVTELEEDLREPRQGGTLRLPVSRVGVSTYPPTLQQQDPLIAQSYLDPLVRIDSVEMTPAPGLASEWSWSINGLELQLTLRDDVYWHDGTRFTAEDARFTHIAYRDDYRSLVAGQSALATNIEAVDDFTLKIEFAEPDGAWLFNVASLPVFQAAQYTDVWTANPEGERSLEEFDATASTPVGTGPWIIEELGDSGVTLVRNQDYFDTSAHADRLDLIAVEDEDQAIELWRAGELDCVPDVASRYIAGLEDETGLVVVADLPRTVFAAFNFDNPNRIDPAMLADVTVREALSLAIDRKRYATEQWGGFLAHSRGGIVPQQWATSQRLSNPSKSVLRAGLNLRNAGWSDYTGDGILESPVGDSLVLTALVLDTVTSEVIDMLGAVDEDLQQIGGALSIQVVSREDFVTIWTEQRTWDLIVYDLRLGPAFAEFDLMGSAWDIRSNPAGWNPGGYSNADVDAAIAEYFDVVSVSEMASALSDLEAALNEDPFALWFGFPKQLLLLRPEVRGVRADALWPTVDTRSLWLDPEV